MSAASIHAEQVLGMIHCQNVPDPQAIADKYAIDVWNPRTEQIEKHRFAFAGRSGHDVYVPVPAYRGEYRYATEKPEKTYFCEGAAQSLRDYQAPALREWSSDNYGGLVAPAGSGKTTIGCALIEEKGVRGSLVVVPTVDIQEQWIERLASFGIEAGGVGGGKEYLSPFVNVATYHSAVKLEGLLKRTSLILIDEMHRIPCASIRDILSITPAYYRYGCTATPSRADGLHEALRFLIGGVTAEIPRSAVGKHILTGRVDVVKTGKCYWGDHNELQEMVAYDRERNESIIRFVERLYFDQRSVLVLCQRLEQIKYLSEGLAIVCDVITGETPKRHRKRIVDDLRCGHSRVLLATYQLAAEGLDIPRLDTLVMAAPIGNAVKVEQAIGRIARPHPDKKDPLVLDYQDSGGMVEALSHKRCKVYKLLGWKEAQDD